MPDDSLAYVVAIVTAAMAPIRGEGYTRREMYRRQRLPPVGGTSALSIDSGNPEHDGCRGTGVPVEVQRKDVVDGELCLSRGVAAPRSISGASSVVPAASQAAI